MSTEKDLNYWKANAEEDYKQVPISVLRYITELETAVKNCSIPDVSDCKKLNIHECLNDIMEVTDRCFGTFGVPRKTLRYQFKKAIDKMICCR